MPAVASKIRLKTEALRFRSFQIEPSDFSSEKRCLRCAFSSETPVLRVGDGSDYDRGEQYYEVLDHDPANADLDLLQNGGALIDEHDWTRQFGSIDKAWIDPDKKGRADLLFADTDLANERYQLMSTGHRKDISFGYILTRKLSEGVATDGIPVIRFAWAAYEITSTAVGAAHFDTGVGRSLNPPKIDFSKLTAAEIGNLTNEQKQHMRILLDPNPTGGGGAATITVEAQQAAVVEAQKLARSNERKRITGIRELGDAFKRDFQHPEAVKKINELVAQAEAGEESPGEFSVRVMVTEAKNFQRASMKVIADEDLHEDIAQYSYYRALRTAVEQDREGAAPTGLEGEVHKELVKRSKSDFTPQGFLVPYSRKMNVAGTKHARMMKRANGDLQVGVFGQGGALVATELFMPLIGLLRNLMVTDRLGMQTISGLEGMVTWPRHVAACTPYFVPETFLLNISNPLLDQLAASPHRVGVTGAISKQLMLQNSIDAQNWLRDDQLKSHAIVVDQVSLLGTGANNQPVGVFNTSGIGAVNFGGAVTYQKVVNFKTQLALGNAAVADMAFVTTPLVEEKWRTTPKIGNQFPIFIWEDGAWGDETADGRVIGLRATATNQILNDRVGFGNFADAKKLFWGGLDVVVNPFTRSKEAVVEVTTNSWMDVMVDHQQSFAYSVDAGDQ